MTNAKCITAIVLCLIMVFSLCSCGGRVVTSQIFVPGEEGEVEDNESVNDSDSTSSEDSSVADTSSDSSSNKNPSSTPSKTPSKNSSKDKESSKEQNNGPNYPEQIKVTVPKTFSGIYGDPGLKTSPVADLWGSDYINCTILGTGDLEMNIQMCMQNGIFFWISMAPLCEAGIDQETKEMKIKFDWKQNMDKIADRIKMVGAWNYFLGWYMDEPLLNRFSAEDVYMFTEYNHNTFQKRYFICFAVEGIAPEGYSDGMTRGSMTKETAKYITDCAYDMYWEFDKWEDKYKLINKSMKKRLSDDCKIWYIPWAYGSTDAEGDRNKPNMKAMAENEQMYIDHLNGMYNFLKEEKNPGGLFPFLFSGDHLAFYGIEEMVEAGHWTNYFELLKKYGRELVGKKVNQ